MDERLKALLEQSHENYTNAAMAALKIVSKQPLPTATDKLLGALVQVEVTNGCILAEILSLLNTPKDGEQDG